MEAKKNQNKPKAGNEKKQTQIENFFKPKPEIIISEIVMNKEEEAEVFKERTAETFLKFKQAMIEKTRRLLEENRNNKEAKEVVPGVLTNIKDIKPKRKHHVVILISKI